MQLNLKGYRFNLLIPLLNLFAGFIIIGLFVFFDISHLKNLQNTQLLETSEEYAVEQSKLLRQFTDHSESVILGLRQNQAFDNYLATDNPSYLQNLFKYAISAEEYVMQIRFIDADGMEVVRFDRNKLDTEAFEVLSNNLQDKSNRDYVQKNLRQADRIWFSKLDLNVEHGKVQIPFNPTFRIVLPVWHERTFKGMLVINYFAQVMIDSIYKMDNYHIRIVDAKGYILYSSDKNEEWSQYVQDPFTLPRNIKESIQSSNVITDTIATIPINTPFENKLWLMLEPSDSYILDKTANERHRITTVATIVIIITLILSVLIYLIVRRLNLQLQSVEVERKIQEKILEDHEKIISMNKLIDRYVITSTTDLNGIITDASEAFCRISEYTKEELIGNSHSILRHTDMPDEIYKELWKSIKADKTWVGEIKNRTKYGSFYWVHALISPLYDNTGTKIGYTAIREDITNAKIIEENFGELESRITAINNNSLTGLYVYDFSLQCNTYVNPKYIEITGYSLEDLKKMDHNEYMSLFHEEDQPKINSHIQKVIKCQQNSIADIQYRFRHKKGHWVWCYARDILLEWDDKGSPLTMLGSIMDVTEFVTLQESVKEQEKFIIQQSKLASMGEMIANIAHQWKQPLMILSMGVLSLQKKYAKGDLNIENMDAYASKTKELIERMNQTIHDFSQYFAPNKSVQTFDISSCIQRSVNFLEPVIKTKNISLELELLPDSMLVGFENELSQVILNLLKNGVDAIREQDVEHGVITIRMYDAQKEWGIDISDNGGGIPDEIMHRIYEPYFTTKYKSDGTGIGLYMSKMIVEESLKGTLEVKNNDIGAVFTIKLPKENIDVFK